ncbi:RNA-directed DNA polymerase, eukaryota, reverse transcriptase zinc-binding domain protein [Tanacetum coccineum]
MFSFLLASVSLAEGKVMIQELGILIRFLKIVKAKLKRCSVSSRLKMVIPIGQALPLKLFLMFSIASWNIQGLNRTLKQSEVRQVVNENHLSVYAILESHVDISTLFTVCSKVFRAWEWTSNASFCNKGCQIILGWNKDVVDILVVAQSSQAMHAKIIHRADNKFIFCTIFMQFYWFLLYEFEDVVINSFGLHFTWNQKPKGRGGILKKLDRIMGNTDFVDLFPGAYTIFQPYRISNHSPSVIKIPSITTTKPKPFKFFNFLAHKENFLDVVSNYWSHYIEGHSMFQVVQKMKSLKKLFCKLLHDQGNLHDRVNRLRTELDEVQKAINLDPSNIILRDEEAVYIQAVGFKRLQDDS